MTDKERKTWWANEAQADQLEGCPVVGDTVEMMGIDAVVESVEFIDSHNAWTIHFDANGAKQRVDATQVAELIKSGQMTIK